MEESPNSRALKTKKIELIYQFNRLARGNWGTLGISDFYNELEDCEMEKLGFNKIKCKTHLLGLSRDEKIIWTKLDDSTKLKVKQTQNYGVEVMPIKNESEIKECYKLFEGTAHKHGYKKPEFPIEFYYTIFSEMRNFLRWTVAKKGQNIIANAIHFIFKDTITWWAGASSTSGLQYRPNNAIVWDAIRWGCVNGYKYYNLGGSPISAAGLQKFKQSWGAIEKEYWFYYKKSSGFKMLHTLRNIF